MKCKRIMMNTVATVVTGLAFVACSDDLFTEQDALNHAKKVLGVEIPADQDWSMSSSVTAQILINMNYGDSYNVKVYSNDPLTNEYGTVLAEGTMEDGVMLLQQFDCPSAEKRLFLGITDNHGYTFYRTAPVVDGKLAFTIGDTSTTGDESRPMARGIHKSEVSPSVPHITIPDDAYAKSFLEGAKEPTDANTTDNYDNSTYSQAAWYSWIGDAATLQYNPGGFTGSEEDRTFFETYCRPYTQYAWNQTSDYFGRTGTEATLYLYQILSEAGKWTSWVSGVTPGYTPDENYVKKFKITGNYNKTIEVLQTEATQGDARTVYVSGKWTIPEYAEQRVGGGAVIVIDDGGELVIPDNAKMTFVNQARLVVMPGGKITGGGRIDVTNGNAEGLEGYNGGTIDIGTFNNNYGTFHNYGTFQCTNLVGGAAYSSIYNHAVVHITRSGKAESWGGNYDTPNLRIYNACHWICDEDMRAFIIEVEEGSYFKVGGELFMSQSGDGTTDESYVALGYGSLTELGTLRNNNTNWIGPKKGYAILEVGGITYLNWTGDEPITSGYFINNIALSIDDPSMGAGQAHGTDAYVAMRDYILNGYGSSNDYNSPAGKTPNPDGNGGSVLVEKGCANLDVEGSEDFEPAVCGCTPGYESTVPQPKKVKPAVWTYAFEDSKRADYDMNDVVLKANYHLKDDYTIDTTKIDITLCCTGASYGLYVHFADKGLIFGGQEVHAALSGTPGMFINTGTGSKFETKDPITIRVKTPKGFNFRTFDFWVDSPEREVHLSTPGQDPHAVMIPADWRWPREWTSIKDAYPEFVNYVADPQNPAYAEWYKHPVEDLLYKK